MSDNPQSSTSKIVVGVDGSTSAEAALRWAVRQAGQTGDIVEAVIAWQFPIVGGSFGWPAAAVIDGTVAGTGEIMNLADDWKRFHNGLPGLSSP